MKFLVISTPKMPPPPEIMPALVEGLIQWVASGKGSGKLEAIYSFAGQSGGMSIADVSSGEELNDIMQRNPWAPFSDIQIFPLSDIDSAMTGLREQVKKMGASRG